MRIDHRHIRSSGWFKYFYESDETDEENANELGNYNFAESRIFQVFQLIRNNNFEIDFFLKVYREQMAKLTRERRGRDKARPAVTPKNEYEFYSESQKIKETTRSHQIKHNLVESELYSLKNSTQSFFEKMGHNKRPLSKEQKLCLRKEISREFLLSEVEQPNVFTILNQMVTFTRLRFDDFGSGEGFSNSTVSKFREPEELSRETFLLNKNDELVLRVLERMVEAGFPLKQVEESVRKKRLDAAWASFRLLAQSLSTASN